MQHATRNTQHAADSMQHATCSRQRATCNTQHSTRNMQQTTFNMQHATFNTQHAADNMQRATSCRTSGRCSHTCQCSPVRAATTSSTADAGCAGGTQEYSHNGRYRLCRWYSRVLTQRAVPVVQVVGEIVPQPQRQVPKASTAQDGSHPAQWFAVCAHRPCVLTAATSAQSSLRTARHVCCMLPIVFRMPGVCCMPGACCTSYVVLCQVFVACQVYVACQVHAVLPGVRCIARCMLHADRVRTARGRS
jgi:hypothetical protein